jgi:hypothetical protein
MPPHQPIRVLLGYARWCGAAVKDSMMGVLANLMLELTNLFFGFGVTDSVTLLDRIGKIFQAPLGDLQIGISEFSPVLLDIGG